MNRDRADIASDGIEAETLRKISGLYNEAVLRALRKCSDALEALRALDEAKPPAAYQGGPAAWRTEKRRRIIRESGLVRAVARELSAAGIMAGDAIFESLGRIEAANLRGEDIGISEK